MHRSLKSPRDLFRNAISSIQAGAFAGLSALRVLRLDDNEISSIQAGAFDGLSALEELRLDDNEISSIPLGLFAGLPALYELIFYNNPVTSFPCDWGGINRAVTTTLQLPQTSLVARNNCYCTVYMNMCLTTAPPNAPTVTPAPPNVPAVTPAPIPAPTTFDDTGTQGTSSAASMFAHIATVAAAVMVAVTV